MSEVTISNTSQSVSRTFWRYAIPSILAMVVNGLYLVIDGIFVGHYVGSDGLAGINMVIPVVAIITGIGVLIGMGGGSIVSQFRGEGKLTDADHTLKTGLWMILVTGVLGSLFLYSVSGWALEIQGAYGDPKQFATECLNIFTIGVSLTIASSALPMLVRNDDSPNISTAFILIGALTNIALDYLFLAHLGMGLKGAAIATLIAQAVTTLLSLGYFLSKYSEANVFGGQFKWKLVWRTTELGASTLVMFVYFGFVMALHNKLFMYYGDSTHVAAFAIVGYIASIYYYFTEGTANGMQPPVSFYFGAKQFSKIKDTVKLALSVSVGLGIVVTILLNIFPEAAISLFTTENPALTTATKQGVQLHLLGICLDGFLFAASVYFMAIGMGGKALFVSAGNMIVQLPFLLVLPQYFGVEGIWLSVPLSNLTLTLVVLPMVISSLRKLRSAEIEGADSFQTV
ncbi:putative Multi antimicrobial extrusion protein MatE [Vibrio nigripulchritudo SFn27]|uniref:Multidrug export protein MepA n=1 Tax=Vibrio nigripulchritudo TaxID=28173 RepID=U4KB14_9VIBR|nr:MATE family efflux transporter [Vibrio nigripulchritudo]CCN80590.1 putative Multi antimicrobial extrusion protein MatE [Vibrio nigripulchritudo BLFn1]CCN90598.1 putative Multi antimicrobial extrusion protein MatE [Vibrio nigripulchritudo SFn27]CCN93465.1 putative Multi antimicrobial extrusion protein MatE [Vibrio nigripulchritudo ENn2]CCO41871.1 putative Multi antimicrobial extrusion protein MatE [Vibrio nigripulchritudo SFn135]CCO52018.1 putative Multi antimicrobial extrusion protein MatE 